MFRGVNKEVIGTTLVAPKFLNMITLYQSRWTDSAYHIDWVTPEKLQWIGHLSIVNTVESQTVHRATIAKIYFCQKVTVSRHLD